MKSATSTPRRDPPWLIPLRAIVDFFDSIWLGIVLIAAILVYAAIGSAVPMFRQYFELTEFAYFNHWIFALLILLFCICLTVTTLRRIPFNFRNAGVLTVHTGLLLLCGGSVIYFGRKIEGDLWLDAPRIRVISVDRLKTNPEQAVLATFVAVKDKTWETNIPMLGGAHRVVVSDVRHEGMTTAAAVKLTARIGDEPPREFELTQSGDPESRFARLSERLMLALTPPRIASTFFDDTTPILTISHGRHTEIFELASLPYYHERFVPEIETVKDIHGKEIPSSRTTPMGLLEKWRMPVALDDSGRTTSIDWPFTVEIDGYLPYARLETEPQPGGTQTTPLAHVRLGGSANPIDQWLIAEMPDRSMMEMEAGPRVEFAWIGESSDLGPAYTRSVPGRHVLEVRVKDRNFRREYVIEPGMTIDVEGTPYRLTIEQLQPSWPLMTAEYKNARTPIALVWVERQATDAGDQPPAFQRSVLQRFPHLNQDRDRAGKRMSDTAAIIDENLELFYTDASTHHFMIFAGQNLAPTLIHTAPGGQRKMQVISRGEPYQAGGGLAVTLLDFIEKPLFAVRPRVIPPNSRRSLGDVKRTESLVRVRLAARDNSWSRYVWVPFSHYNNQTMIDINGPTPVNDVPGMDTVHLLYGRRERALPGRVTLEQLKTDFYPGRQQPSEWTSHFRFEDANTRQVRAAKAFLNNTARIGDWTLFQSQAAGDHESWTVLGVGNREGVMTMLAGCTLITLGMIFAFAVKPILIRRRREQIERANLQNKDEDSMNGDGSDAGLGAATTPQPISTFGMMLLVLTLGCATVSKADQQSPGGDIAAIQDQINLDTLGALVLQHHWRYATVDSWARDAIKTMYGKSSLWQLDPVASAMEIMFNAEAHHAEPIIYVKDKALLLDLTAHPVQISDEDRRAMLKSGRVSYDFLRTPTVSARLQQLAGEMLKKKAMDRLMGALNYYESIVSTFTIVPNPKGAADSPWSSPAAVMSRSMRGSSGLSDAQASELGTIVNQLGVAWRARNVPAINAEIAKLDKFLPTLAPEGTYLPLEKRQAEVTYRRMNLLWWSWLMYIFAFFISIYALATRYGWVRTTGLAFLVAAITLHAIDIGQRWYVLGRIPVANMFEAVVSSALTGAVFALVLELFLKKRVYMLAAGLLGFFSLALPELLPDKIDDKLTTMMPILDDIMLRIHTVLIISSYAVITLAYGVANCYLFVAARRNREPAAYATIGAQAGAILCLCLAKFGYLASTEAFLIAIASAIVGGAFMAVGLAALRGRPALIPALAGAGGGVFGVPDLEPPSQADNSGGGSPRRIDSDSATRDLLQEFDLSHRVLLYTSMVALFVGLVLGAIWADYSWGRPWGWDPKEVFALNTWLVYAILIHVRFVTRKRALWTSILSVIGFAAMQFNWWVVNFYIVGLHSYA